jgi:DNA-directed RNA polymerase subunit H
MKAKYDVTKHVLVPKHAKATEKEKRELLERYQISIKELPRIVFSDPAIQHLDASEGDLIKITRPSPTAGETVFFRRVING